MAQRTAFAAVLLLSLFVADRFDLLRVTLFQLERGDTESPGLNAAGYALTYLVAAAGLLALLLHPWRPLRFLAFFVGGFLTAVHVGFQAVNGTGFGHHEASILWSDTPFAGDALTFFAPSYLGPVGVVAAVTCGLALWASRVAFRRGALLLLALPLLGTWSADRLIDRTFGKVYQTPAPIRAPLLARWALEHSVPYYGPRSEPVLEPRRPPVVPHLVLVMDESIAGHWLGINGGHPETTPWLGKRPEHVFNYGIASAISNLSSSSNLLLLTGLTSDALPDRELRSLRDPTVFSYMARAGYHTSFFDAQSYSKRPPNLMTRFDLEGVDVHRQVREEEPSLPAWATDRVTIGWIRDQIESAERSFSYVLKNGAHIPYDNKAPPERRPFQPTPGSGLSGSLELRANAYRNALAWSSDRYLEELSRALKELDREVLVVYTSDHGQSLSDTKGKRRFTPHATEIGPPAEQAAVPLVLLAFGQLTQEEVRAHFAPELVDRASQFELFPTLLELAGYAREEATAGRAPSLFDAQTPRTARVFVSGNIFAREGGFYVLNPRMGSAFYLNDFEPPEPR